MLISGGNPALCGEETRLPCRYVEEKTRPPEVYPLQEGRPDRNSWNRRKDLRHGSVISRARGERKPMMSFGIILFLIIQNPAIPIPKSATTDSNVAMSRFIPYPVSPFTKGLQSPLVNNNGSLP